MPYAVSLATVRLREYLALNNLEVNPEKEKETMPGQPWTFLGFECNSSQIASTSLL